MTRRAAFLLSYGTLKILFDQSRSFMESDLDSQTGRPRTGPLVTHPHRNPPGGNLSQQLKLQKSEKNPGKDEEGGLGLVFPNMDLVV